MSILQRSGRVNILLNRSRSHGVQSSSNVRLYHPDLDKPPYVLPSHSRISCPPMVYISGEEMTRYTMKLIIEKWIEPHVDISQWQFFDLSCKNRDSTDDEVLNKAVKAGSDIGSIFKEPTITPSASQVEAFGLSKPLPSPNGAMREGGMELLLVVTPFILKESNLGLKTPCYLIAMPLVESIPPVGKMSAGAAL